MAEIEGEEEILEEDTYSFTIDDAIGQTGSYTYTWFLREDGEGDFNQVGTGQIYNRLIEEDDPDFELKMDITSGGVTLEREMEVLMCWNHEGINCEGGGG